MKKALSYIAVGLLLIASMPFILIEKVCLTVLKFVNQTIDKLNK
jgi:hypothetical protein